MTTRGGLALAILGAVGCASGPRPRVAILPVVWRTRDPLTSLDERAPFADAMRRTEAVDARDAERACEADDADCAREVGREAGAQHVVTLSMAALGETVLARASMIDLEGGTASMTQQRVVQSYDEAQVRRALSELGTSFADPFRGDDTPAIVGVTVGVSAALAVAAIALGVALAPSDGPDQTVRPP
ncbi:MAG: hypothetical protein AB7S26_40545 [Sandaracinaceae bacterium]